MTQGVVVTDQNRRAVLVAMAVGRQRALRDFSDVFEQMLNQLYDCKEKFDREIFALQQELAEAQRQLQRMRELAELSRWQPINPTAH